MDLWFWVDTALVVPCALAYIFWVALDAPFMDGGDDDED
jgi:hypothetical protein